MKVVVGIITINRAHIIPKAIDSVLNQKLENIKISVFDDGSTDDIKKLQHKYPQVDWYFAGKQVGYIYGRNKIMKETNAQYFCSLDDDAWFLDGNELEIACKYMDEHPDVGAIAFDILSKDFPNRNPVKNPQETNLFIGCGHLLRMEAVRKLNYYTYYPGFYGGEEKDMCIRLIDEGYKIIKLPGIHIWHDISTVARKPAPEIWASLVCNDLSFAYLRFPLLLMVTSIGYKTLLNLTIGIRRKQATASLKGIRSFIIAAFSGKLKRKPVKLRSFKKFRSLY